MATKQRNYSIRDTTLTASRALVADANKTISVSAVTSTELGYLSGKTMSGSDATIITGTAGTNNYTAKWNTDGDLVDGYALSGSDATIISGTAGTNGNTGQWNADGDLVDGKALPSGDIVGTSDSQILTTKTIDVDSNTVSNIEVDNFKSSALTGSDAKVVTGTAGTNNYTAKWNTDGDLVDGYALSGADSAIISGTAGTDGNCGKWNADGDLVDGKTLPTGDIVGRTDTQVLTNKTLDADDNTISDLTAANLKSGDGLTMKKLARATFSYSDQSGSGAYDTSVTLPDNAIITKVYYDVTTTFGGDGDDSSTIAIHVEGANDIVTATAISTGGDIWDVGIHEGIPKTEDTATWVKTTQARNITVTVAINATDTALDAGSMVIFVEYVISQ